jgi:cystathionine gamma-synthase
MTSKKNVTAASLAAQAMGWIDPVTKAVVPPIHMASTYERDEDNGYRSGRIYARADNPTFDQAEATLAALEGGAKALVFSSGMSAATACFLALAPGDPRGGAEGDVLVAAQLARQLRDALGSVGRVRRCGQTDAIAKAVRPRQPGWYGSRRPPIRPGRSATSPAAAEIAHRAGALLAVDSTVATPVLTRPIEHGADLVMHSATKYLNGHSDIIAGALVGARDDEHWAKLRAIRAQLGTILGQTEAWLLMRGMRTLFPRVQWACRSADALAQKFAAHPMVAEVLYPGLPVVRRPRGRKQADGRRLRRHAVGPHQGRRTRRDRDRGAGRAVEAGDVAGRRREPDRASRQHRGPGTPCPPDLLRLSVGVEDAGDLYDDLDQALRRAHNA